MKQTKKNSINKNLKIFVFIVYDILAFAFSWTMAMILSEYRFSECFSKTLLFFIGGILLVIATNSLLGLYSRLWRYAGIADAVKIFASSFIVAAYVVLVRYFSAYEELRMQWAIIVISFYFVLIAGSRFFYRMYKFLSSNADRVHNVDNAKRVMIIGAGSATDELLRDMSRNSTDLLPVCVIDDDKNKIGQSIGGVSIVGSTEDIKTYAEKYAVNEIIVAVPSASRKDKKRIMELCGETGCKVLSIPGYHQILNEEVSVSQLRNVEITDLLGRDSVNVNVDEIIGYIEGKTVLVTGGGGSIGSELCRQIATHNPRKLIIADIYENNAYDIQQELKRKVPELDLTVLIASVRDFGRVEDIFRKYEPQIVFHAAAHKHVPLMEASPNEAVKNNIGGTFNVADAAGRFGAERFILISTDKAVNPTNVMGATKRVCEMIVQTLDKKYVTDYVAVRFGNVLGSNGSVIPLFKKQIEEGGPVTVTHKDIVRYFMTIPEAVSLVLQAGAFASGGEIFVLDMGEQVRIYDLAVQLIKLSGLEPFKDIDIKITGLRPGEKLYEERLMAEEGLKKTANEMISIGRPLVFDEDNLFSSINTLLDEAYNETDKIKELLSRLVSTYTVDKKSN